MGKLYRVLSGGQTGVDVAALRAAKQVGLVTGGWMPQGFRTLDGPRPAYEKSYGMRQTQEFVYSKRTAFNVRDADATLRVAVDFESPGERCTLKAIKRYRKPHFDLSFETMLRSQSPLPALVSWLRAQDNDSLFWVLNVAGNSEDTAPGIEEIAEGLLVRVFSVYLGRDGAP